MNDVVNYPRLPRMRTVSDAHKELLKLDPYTAVTQYHIRRLAIDGVIPRVKSGKKYLINLDVLIEYLKNPDDERFTRHSDTDSKEVVT